VPGIKQILKQYRAEHDIYGYDQNSYHDTLI
jgi:hypothetical protein